MHLFHIAAADRELSLLLVLQPDLVAARKPSHQLSNECNIYDRRAVDADESLFIQPNLESGYRVIDHVFLFRSVKECELVFGFEIHDIPEVDRYNLISQLDHDPLKRG